MCALANIREYTRVSTDATRRRSLGAILTFTSTLRCVYADVRRRERPPANRRVRVARKANLLPRTCSNYVCAKKTRHERATFQIRERVPSSVQPREPKSVGLTFARVHPSRIANTRGVTREICIFSPLRVCDRGARTCDARVDACISYTIKPDPAIPRGAQ